MTALDLDAIETYLVPHLGDIATFARVSGAVDPILDSAAPTMRALVESSRAVLALHVSHVTRSDVARCRVCREEWPCRTALVFLA